MHWFAGRERKRMMKLQNMLKNVLAAAIISAGVFVGSIGALAAGTCTVVEGAAKIRETASTSAEVVGSTTKGSKLDVIAKTEPGDGYTWYKVKVEGDKTGYIRGDLVNNVEGDISSEGGASTTTTESSAPAEASSVQVDPCEYTTGTTAESVSVRATPSTNAEKKATTTAGQAVAINGQTKGSDGNIWYQIAYGDVTGYIRSDLVQVSGGEAEAPVDEFTEEGSEGMIDESEESWDDVVAETTSAPNTDYELKYEANDAGVDTWYLYDHINGTRQSLDNIYAVMRQSQTLQAADTGSSSKMKTIIIIMGVVILILIIAVTILLFKLRDSYEDWEDEDDEDEEEEEDEYDNVTVAKKRVAVVNNQQINLDDDEELDDEDIKIVTRKGKAKKASSLTKPSRSVQEDRKEAWQSKQFLELDDDMEFEFLDIDNK